MDGTPGFPTRDTVPAEILAPEVGESKEHYQSRCFAFFTAIFITLTDYMHKITRCVRRLKGVTIVERWRQLMDVTSDVAKRETFFQRVRTEYNAVRIYSPQCDVVSRWYFECICWLMRMLDHIALCALQRRKTGRW